MAKLRPEITPEWLTGRETAEIWFGIDYGTFKKWLPELEARGFPVAHPFGKRYLPALRRWAFSISGVRGQDNSNRELQMRLREFEHG